MIKQINKIISDSEDITYLPLLCWFALCTLQAVTQDGGNNVGMKCEIVMADTNSWGLLRAK